MDNSTPVLEVKNLVKHFPVSGKKDLTVKAVDGVSFTIPRGKTMGLVGESGCGKSTVARTVIKIYDPTSGQVFLDGDEIGGKSARDMKPYRKKMQMIFQDPYSSLNGRMTVRDIIAEPLISNGIGKSTAERNEMVEDALAQVGLGKEHANRYPHEFSGGQRQRIGIARVLIIKPQLVICDEPISALDVSIQAQVVNMLSTFQSQLGLTYLFIAHDLSMVRYVSDRVGVMYLGKIVEECDSEEIYTNSLHPYTKALLAAVPASNPRLAREKTATALMGEVPSPINPPPGCTFHKRCPNCMDKCKTQTPIYKDAGSGHFVACHLY